MTQGAMQSTFTLTREVVEHCSDCTTSTKETRNGSGEERDLTIDLRDAHLLAQAVCEGLDLSPHPEGGHYREVWRDRPSSGGRGVGTSIVFLLAEGERSQWHRIDATELWLWQAGAALQLAIDDAENGRQEVRLGPDVARDELLQAVVPAGVWQSARSLGAWSLVSCVVAPAFEFSGFELAPEGWSPAAGSGRP